MNSSQTPKRILGKPARPSTVTRANSNPAKHSNGGPNASTSTGGDTMTLTPSGKKKRKKTGTKEERLRKREEKKFNEMYAPKDTRVSLISASVLERFRGLSIDEMSRSIPAWSSAASALELESESQWPSVSSASASAQYSPSCRYKIQGKGVTPDLKPKLPVDLEFPVVETPVSTSIRTHKPVKLIWGRVPENLTGIELSKPILTDELVIPPAADLSSTTSSPDAAPNLTKMISKGLSKKPLVVNIAELITLNKKKLGDVLKGAENGRGDFRTPKTSRKSDNTIQKAGNLLDSSGPIVTHRGKIRKPKVKKPTPLKRAILTSRALRKVTIGAHFGPGQDLIIKFETETKPEILKVQLMTATVPTEVEKSENEAKVKVEPDAIIEVKPTKEELLFRKLVEESVNEAQKKVAPVPDSVLVQVKTQMHSRKFRSYCDMYVSKELHGHVIGLLKFLHRLQDKLYHTDPIKYSTKKRYVIGLKNVKGYLSLHKVQFIIIAPDMEQNNVEGGLDEKVEDLIELAKKLNVPYIFSGHRFILGYPIFIKTPVAAIGVLDYQGGEDLIRKILEEAEKLRENYKTEFDRRVQELCKSQDAGACP